MDKNLKKIDLMELEAIKNQLGKQFAPKGFELHPFKVGWYNSKVLKAFKLPYHEDGLAFVVISTPAMFENTFLPYVNDRISSNKIHSDLLDQCMISTLSSMRDTFPVDDIDIFHDFELTPMRRPKILMQTAGHISGAVKFYQRKDVINDSWNENKKIFGVCVHPKYGGWFGLRAVVVFRRLTCPILMESEPRNLLPDESSLITLLNLFNDSWQDGRYRDIITVEERYSELQQTYFSMKPCYRLKWLQELLHDTVEKDLTD